MLENLACLAVLMAPEIAEATADAVGSGMKGLGQKFAEGMYDELKSKATGDMGSLVGSISGFFAGGNKDASNLQSKTKAQLDEATRRVLSAIGAELVPVEELTLLREVAATASTGGDVSGPLEALQAYLRKNT